MSRMNPELNSSERLLAEEIISAWEMSGLAETAEVRRAKVAAKAAMAKLHPVAPHWQPIETAPKDGTHILVTHGKPVTNAPRHCYIARYMPPYKEWYLDGGGILASSKLSHWMPLPEAPK